MPPPSRPAGKHTRERKKEWEQKGTERSQVLFRRSDQEPAMKTQRSARQDAWIRSHQVHFMRHFMANELFTWSVFGTSALKYNGFQSASASGDAGIMNITYHTARENARGKRSKGQRVEGAKGRKVALSPSRLWRYGVTSWRDKPEGKPCWWGERT